MSKGQRLTIFLICIPIEAWQTNQEFGSMPATGFAPLDRFPYFGLSIPTTSHSFIDSSYMGADVSAVGTMSDLSGLIRSDFWFLDGNIVIIAGQAAFKVHRGQLERHSEVFNGLFSVPQPAEQDLLDGCLWVELHDRPSDVFYFLSALYDGLYVSLSFI